MEERAESPSAHDGDLSDISNNWHLSDTLRDGVSATSVALQVTVVYLTDTNELVGEEGVLVMSGLEEVEVVVHDGGVKLVLQHENVRTVEDPCQDLSG